MIKFSGELIKKKLMITMERENKRINKEKKSANETEMATTMNRGKKILNFHRNAHTHTHTHDTNKTKTHKNHIIRIIIIEF